MAVLGIQIVITMMMASIMSKIGPYLSFSRWLLSSTGLVRYMHPSDEELRGLALVPKERPKKKGGHRRENNGKAENNGVFNVPRNIDVQLETTKVSVMDIVQLRFYTEYQWLIDFAVYSVIVYTLTEIYIGLFPARALQEVNLSMVWCALVVGFAYKILISLAGLYFEGEDTGERSLVICMGFAYLFFSMMILIVHEDTLETGLDEAYASFNRSAAMFLENNAGLDSSGPASKLVLKFFLAVWCGSIGALFTFPGLRMARMQWDVLRYTDSGPVAVLLHICFISPLVLTTLWVRPLSRDYLTGRIFTGMSAPLMTEDQFETLRLLLVIAVIGLRLALMPRYLQSYLNMAYHKMEDMKQEAGKISNVDLQKMVARIFYYLCVVTLQYLAPMMLIFFLSLMYKTMGGGSWTGLWAVIDKDECGVNEEAVAAANQKVELQIGNFFGKEEDEAATEALKGQFSLAWQSLREVFTTAVFRGLLGFSTWWCCFTWFVSSAIGIGYQSYFAKV